MSEKREKVVLITGATDGLGLALAGECARRGASVLLHGRSQERLAAARAEVERAGGGSAPRGYLADFSELAQVRAMSQAVLAQEARIDVLVNNAGLGIEDRRRESADRLELVFQVDYLATYMLSRLLLPLLRASAPARIVNVASAGQAPIDFDDPLLERGWSGTQAYCQAKLAQIMLAVDMADELRGSGVTVNALHPSTYMPTKMVVGKYRVMSAIEDGVAATARLALDDDVARVSGAYFDRQRRADPHPQAADARARARLNELSERLTGVPARAAA